MNPTGQPHPGAFDSIVSPPSAIRNISIEQLAALQQVVQDGGFEAAADELHVSQSAISQRIKVLESQVGRIVVQRTKPARATPTGQLLLRLARQIRLAQEEAAALIDSEQRSSEVNVRLAVNADSLESWVLPALAPVATRSIAIEIRRQDERLSTRLLKSGEVMAAITTQNKPVQGCSITFLGSMEYRAVCTPRFARRWFARGLNVDSLNHAPLVQYDREDHLQDNFIRTITKATVHPPMHYIPTSGGYNKAVTLGYGWGLVPEATLRTYEQGAVVAIAPGAALRVPLYWQQWKFSSPTLDEVAQAIVTAAHGALVQ